MSIGCPKRRSGHSASTSPSCARPGFAGFHLIADERGDLFVGVTVWEDKASADAFEATMSDWLQVLEDMGHKGQTENRGETVEELQPAS